MESQKLLMDGYDCFLFALGERIKQHRLQRGWTQHYVVKNTDFYDSHWRRIEHGKTMSLQTLYKISKFYGVHISELLVGIEIVSSGNEGNLPKEQSSQERGPAASQGVGTA
jgi:transcriptional regulator with XRE-family HTH domain